jgi:cellulose biosynthesis protein BcsQ
MKILSVFNNKGGVGKTTLTFHLAHILSSMGNKVLLLDADPQCNLTIYSTEIDVIHKIWADEDDILDSGIEDFEKNNTRKVILGLQKQTRSLHYILQPTIEGVSDYKKLSPPLQINENLHIIPGRLSIQDFEDKVSARWSDAYRGDALAIRTITKIRNLAEDYAKEFNYNYVIIDTSPSLGAMNKTIISTFDGFFVPAAPDMFSLYGIRNIGKSLKKWKEEFDIIFKLISNEKRGLFPKNFVKFLGYTIYNAKKYEKYGATWNLAQAHLQFALKIPEVINKHIDPSLIHGLDDTLISQPIGGESIMHGHNTFPALAQHYRVPMWEIPGQNCIDSDHKNTINGQKDKILKTKDKYQEFATDLISRIEVI